MSQKREILSYLKKGYKLTPLQALKLFGCYRLSARINELRKEGYKISTKIHYKRNKKYSVYKMEELCP